MSNRAITWAYRQRTGSGARKAVLVALADQANSDGVCWPGQKSLAEDLEMSERSVRRALTDLEDDGFVSVQHRRWEDSQKQRTNYYLLNLTRADTVTAGAGGHSDRGPEDTVTGQRADTVTAEEPSALNPKPEPQEPSSSDKQDDGLAAKLFQSEEVAVPADEQTNPSRCHTSDRETFERFWERYPTQPNGKKPEKPKAWDQWKKLKPAQRERVLVAVEHYRADCDRGTYAKHAHRWLRDRTYEDWQTPATPPSPNGKAAEPSQYRSPEEVGL